MHMLLFTKLVEHWNRNLARLTGRSSCLGMLTSCLDQAVEQPNLTLELAVLAVGSRQDLQKPLFI